MIRDITLGQYYQTESLIHRFDGRVKLIATVLFVISLFWVDSFVGYAGAALFLVFVIALSKVPFPFMVKGMKAIMFLILITVVFNLFLTPGEVLVSVWKLQITKEGLQTAVFMTLRIVKTLRGKRPSCCSGGGAGSCPHCAERAGKI